MTCFYYGVTLDSDYSYVIDFVTLRNPLLYTFTSVFSVVFAAAVVTSPTSCKLITGNRPAKGRNRRWIAGGKSVESQGRRRGATVLKERKRSRAEKDESSGQNGKRGRNQRCEYNHRMK